VEWRVVVVVVETATKPSRFAHCRIPCACHTKRHPNVQECAEPLSFSTFDFEMCFAPQRRALFQHRNFQKCPEAEVFCKFWLPNVLRAPTACTFSTSQLPKVLRTHQFFTLVTSKCDYFSTLRSHKSLEKHSVSRLYYLFAHLDLLSSRSSFFWLLLFADLLSSSLLFSSLPWLCFSSVHIVGSLTSKLPSTMMIKMGHIMVGIFRFYTHGKHIDIMGNWNIRVYPRSKILSGL